MFPRTVLCTDVAGIGGTGGDNSCGAVVVMVIEYVCGCSLELSRICEDQDHGIYSYLKDRKRQRAGLRREFSLELCCVLMS